MDAIQVYERMLTISPGNAVVNRLRIRAFSDMGASMTPRAAAVSPNPAVECLA